jgi:hypothetical protein
MNLPTDLPAMLAALVAEHYSVSFTLDTSGRARCLADLTGPLGSQATGLGDTPAAALLSVWPFGGTGHGQEDGQEDENIMDGPAVAALARKAAALSDYVSAVLAPGGQLVSHQHALEHAAGELASIGALLAADPEVIEAGAGDELEPYCRACGHWIGQFLGRDGWQHYRGEPAAGGRRTLHDAGHPAVPAWCVPPGRLLAPADVAAIRTALDEAVKALQADCTGFCAACEAAADSLCGEHDAALGRVTRYRELAGMLGTVNS